MSSLTNWQTFTLSLNDTVSVLNSGCDETGSVKAKRTGGWTEGNGVVNREGTRRRQSLIKTVRNKGLEEKERLKERVSEGGEVAN